MKPFISILIPCFNAERWVKQAIESALGQTQGNTEVIVIDDGSTDGSLGIIGSFGDRIRWETGPNRGSNRARNRLIELAHGEWVQFLDADDYLKPDKIAAQASVIAAHPELDVLFGPSIVEWHHHGRLNVTLEETPEPHDLWMLLALWKLPQTGAPLWRKSALLEVGGWCVEQPCCQEHELYFRLLAAGRRFKYHNATGAVYRRFANGSLSTRNPPLVRRERLKIEKRIEEHLSSIGALTTERQWAINQGRFEMARSAWNEDQKEARAIFADIAASDRFRPAGVAAPLLYRLAFRLFGFETTERIAAVRRAALRPPGDAIESRLRSM
jgi:glycosyltransferase involved in cell wall biosynthesis